MNFVEDDPFQLANHIRAIVQHRSEKRRYWSSIRRVGAAGYANIRSEHSILPEDLRRHNQAERIVIQLDIASDQSNISERLFEIAEFLIR